MKHETIGDVFAVADGCIVGSALKFGGTLGKLLILKERKIS